MTQATSSSRNLFVPSREEAEELERALAEDVPIAISSDLSDLALIDDHTALALAHDLVMSAAAGATNLLMAPTNEAIAQSHHASHLYSLDSNVLMDQLHLHHSNTSSVNPGIGLDEC